MKLPPLSNRERPHHRMIHYLRMRSELRCAVGQNSIHLCDLRDNLSQDLPRRNASGTRTCRRLDTIWKISNIDDHQSSDSLLQGRVLRRAVRCENSGKSLNGSRIRKVEMLQNFRCAPFPGRMPIEFFYGNAFGDRVNFVLELLEMRVHERY